MGGRAPFMTKMRLDSNSSKRKRILSLVGENNTREIWKRNESTTRRRLKTPAVGLNLVRVVLQIMLHSHLRMLSVQVRHSSTSRLHSKVMDPIKANLPTKETIPISIPTWSRSRKSSKRTQMPGSLKRTKEGSCKMRFLKLPCWRVHRSEPP